MNRVERAYGDCKILLKPNPKQGLTDKYFLIVNSEDYIKIKDYNWKVAKIGANLTATTYIKNELVNVTKILFPDLKRIHRVNDNSLDNRRFNIKHFRNDKVVKKESKQETIQVKEEIKMIPVTRSNYDTIKKLSEKEGLNDLNSVVSVLLESYSRYKIRSFANSEEPKTCSCDCNTSLLSKLKAKLRIA